MADEPISSGGGAPTETGASDAHNASGPLHRVPSGHVSTLTETQKETLKAFVEQLRTEWSSKSSELGLTETDLSIWNVDLAPLVVVVQPATKADDGDEASSSAAAASLPEEATQAQSIVLLKFLRARNFVLQDAQTMLFNCLKWRSGFRMADLMKETFPESIASLGEVYGRDKEGCPVTYNYYGKLDVDQVFASGTPDAFVRWRVQLMEKAIAQLDWHTPPVAAAGSGGDGARQGGGGPVIVERVGQVHDYQGATMRPKGMMKQATQTVIKLFSDNYPEFLAWKLFVNVPVWMGSVFSVVSMLSPVKTKALFRMVGSRNARGEMLEYVAISQLPPRFGGFQGVARTEESRGRGPTSSEEEEDVAQDLTVGARGKATVFRAVTKGEVVPYHFVTTGLDVEYAAGWTAKLPEGAQVGTPFFDLPPLEDDESPSTSEPGTDGTAATSDEDGTQATTTAGSPDPKGHPLGNLQRVEMHSGEIKASADGFVYLFFNNSYSLLTSKRILYAL